MDKLLYWCTLGNHPEKGGFTQNLGFLPISAEDVLDCCYFEYKPRQLIGLPTAQERDQLHVLALKAPIPVVEQVSSVIEGLTALLPLMESVEQTDVELAESEEQ